LLAVSLNVPGVNDVAPAFGAQCGVAQATDRERSVYPVLSDAANNDKKFIPAVAKDGEGWGINLFS